MEGLLPGPGFLLDDIINNLSARVSALENQVNHINSYFDTPTVEPAISPEPPPATNLSTPDVLSDTGDNPPVVDSTDTNTPALTTHAVAHRPEGA